MTIWTDRPDFEDGFPSYRLLRTPQKGRLSMIILSAKPIGTLMHFWKGRSSPCNKTDCEACKAGHRPRWKGYLFAAGTHTKRVVIFEYTERGHQEIELFLAKYGSLKGAKLTAERTGNRPNSPLRITFEEERADIAGYPEPDGLDVILERMWENRQMNLPLTDPGPPPEYATNGKRF